MHGNLKDRRVLRTRELLTETFASLLSKRAYHRITVQNIVEAAGVSRSTFYAHYDDMTALLADTVRRLRHDFSTDDSCRTPASDPSSHHRFLYDFFRHVEKHRHPAGEGRSSADHAIVEQHVYSELVSIVRSRLSMSAPTAASNEETEASVQALAGAMWSLGKWWKHSRSSLTPEQLARALSNISLQESFTP